MPKSQKLSLWVPGGENAWRSPIIMAEPSRRRTDRILAPVRIRVIGNDASGVAFAEETVTVSFNQQGARISLTHSLLPDDIVLIKNLQNEIEEEFRVVGGFQQVFGSRREWGVEAINPESGIWGFEFTRPPEGLQPKVLIECGACHRALQSPLSSIEYDVLLATGLISRHCDRCAETTRWKPSEQTLTPEMIAEAAKPIQAGDERRRVRRLRLAMRLRIRTNWGATETAQTRDVSKSGLCFISQQNYSVGDEIFLTLPFSDQQAPVETRSQIVWSLMKREGRHYGVKYLK